MVQDANVDPGTLPIYLDAATSGLLTMKVVAAQETYPGKAATQVDDLVRLRDRFSYGRLRASSAKSSSTASSSTRLRRSSSRMRGAGTSEESFAATGLYIYGYLNPVQSSRRLEREAGRNVEVMWLTGRLVPDHKTIANAYMPTLTAIRCSPALHVFSQRLIGRGHPPKVAITACMRKLLTIVNAILRDHRPWQAA
jgi:hypothetical protein